MIGVDVDDLIVLLHWWVVLNHKILYLHLLSVHVVVLVEVVGLRLLRRVSVDWRSEVLHLVLVEVLLTDKLMNYLL